MSTFQVMFELSGISKSYRKQQVLHNLSLNLQEGEIFGLLGPNGAGKSTLIRIINQIVEPDTGSMKYKNDLFRQKHLVDFGYLPEERGLYKNMTVVQHALFLGRLRGMTKTECKTNISYWLRKFKIEDWGNKRIEELSKGMAQKVQFIMAVLHQPKVLILDEPFSGFDPLNIELIRKEIYAMKEEGRTILISTHNMNSVEEICDRAMLIHQGKMVVEGSVQDLRERGKKGHVTIRFKGNMIGFVNALWAGYTVEDQRALNNDRYRVEISYRRENTLKDLLAAIVDHVTIESIEETIPSMQDVFVQAINAELKKESDEEH